jgi:hypothetical protein
MRRFGGKTVTMHSGRWGGIGSGMEIIGGAAVNRWPDVAIPVMILGAVPLIWGLLGFFNDWRSKRGNREIKIAAPFADWRLAWLIWWRKKATRSIAPDLYVGEINFALNRLKDDRYITIAVRVFNGTSFTIAMSEVRGSISFGTVGDAQSVRLPPPTIKADTPKTINPGGEWFIVLDQRVPAVLADQISALLSGEKGLIFYLDALDILVAMGARSEKTERLLLWSELVVKHGISQMRHVSGSMAVTEGVRAANILPGDSIIKGT